MDNIKKQDKLATFLIDIISEPLVIVDIGCGGEVEPIWESLYKKISYFGYDISRENLPYIKAKFSGHFKFLLKMFAVMIVK